MPHTVPFQPQVQSQVTSNPELNLFAKSSRSQVAHAAKQGAYLLLLNVILILIFLPSAMHVTLSDTIFMMSTSKQYLDTPDIHVIIWHLQFINCLKCLYVGTTSTPHSELV